MSLTIRLTGQLDIVLLDHPTIPKERAIELLNEAFKMEHPHDPLHGVPFSINGKQMFIEGFAVTHPKATEEP